MPKSCNIKVVKTVKGKIKDVLAKVKALAKTKDVKFDGDEKKGAFSGDAKGTYTVDGQTITVIITERPYIATDGLVKGQLEDFFNGL